MTVSPKFSMYYSIAIAILAFIASGIMPSYVPSSAAKWIAETATFLIGLSSSVNAALHGLSGPQQGPLVPPTSAAKILP